MRPTRRTVTMGSQPPTTPWSGGDQIPFCGKFNCPQVFAQVLPASVQQEPWDWTPQAALGWPPYALQQRDFFLASSREGKIPGSSLKGLAWATYPAPSQSCSHGDATCCRKLLFFNSHYLLPLPLPLTHWFGDGNQISFGDPFFPHLSGFFWGCQSPYPTSWPQRRALELKLANLWKTIFPATVIGDSDKWGQAVLF